MAEMTTIIRPEIVIKVEVQTPRTMVEIETSGDRMKTQLPHVPLMVSLTIEVPTTKTADRTTTIIREEIISQGQWREGRLANMGMSAESTFQEIPGIVMKAIQDIIIKTNLDTRTPTEALDKTEKDLLITISKANTYLGQ